MAQAGSFGIITHGKREFPCESLFDILMLQRLSGGKAAWDSFDGLPKNQQLKVERKWWETPIGKWTWGSIDQKPRGRPKGSTKPQQQKHSDKEKQLEKLIEAIRSWYSIYESYATIPQAMRQIGWWADPKRVRELLHALNQPKWRTFIRQVIHG